MVVATVLYFLLSGNKMKPKAQDLRKINWLTVVLSVLTAVPLIVGGLAIFWEAHDPSIKAKEPDAGLVQALLFIVAVVAFFIISVVDSIVAAIRIRKNKPKGISSIIHLFFLCRSFYCVNSVLIQS